MSVNGSTSRFRSRFEKKESNRGKEREGGLREKRGERSGSKNVEVRRAEGARKPTKRKIKKKADHESEELRSSLDRRHPSSGRTGEIEGGGGKGLEKRGQGTSMKIRLD